MVSLDTAKRYISVIFSSFRRFMASWNQTGTIIYIVSVRVVVRHV